LDSTHRVHTLENSLRLIRLKILVAKLDQAITAKLDGFRPNPGENPDKQGNYWRTTDTGKRYPIKPGEDPKEKAKEFIDKVKDDDAGDEDKKFYELADKILSRTKLLGASYPRKLNRLIDFANEKDARDNFLAHTMDGAPVYAISVTNNKDAFNHKTWRAHEQLTKDVVDKMGHDTALGKWYSNETDTMYYDVTLMVSGISIEEALSLKRKYNQEEIVITDAEGNVNFIADDVW